MDEINEQICRICIVKPGFVSINEKRIQNLTIANLIMQLSNVVINFENNYPNNVCINCAKRLENAWKLKKDCENSDNKIKHFFSQFESYDQFVVKEQLDFGIELNDIPVDGEVEIKNEIKNEDQQIELEYRTEEQIKLLEETSINMEYYVPIKNELEKPTKKYRKRNVTTKIPKTNVDREEGADKSIIETNGDNISDGSWNCEYCDKTFTFRASLSNHMRVHNTIAVTHTCDTCQKGFKIRQNLLNHMRTHTGEKPFECDICLKKFSTRSNVFNHKRTHSNDKPYVCDVCGKQFPTISHLRNHNLSHVPIEERKYKCEQCNKTFRDRKIFKRHLNIHNGIRNEMCEICGKKFCNKNDVTRHHKTVHLGIKKYVCSVCTKPFSNSSNLEAHFRIHTGEKPFACKFCDAKFNQSTPLVKHTKLHIERGDQMRIITVEPEQHEDPMTIFVVETTLAQQDV